MNKTISLKGLTFSVVILLSTACTHVENDKDAIVVQNQSASNIITNLRQLNVEQDIIVNDENLQSFLEGYKHVQIGTIDKAQDIFTSLQSSIDREAREYGEYGLLLISFETENMFDMKQRIQSIEELENKSEWLKNELRNYTVYYNYNIANFDESKRLLDVVPMPELIKSPFLSAIKSDLYIRDNQLDKAKELLEQLEVDSEYLISIEARLNSLTQGNSETVNYIKSKINNYPDNEYLRLLYNQYLILINQKEAIDNASELGTQTENTYILAHSIELLFPNATDSNTLERLNTLNDKLNKSNVAKNYIDYYLINIALPINNKEMSTNLATADEFNPMNYNLLMHKYYVAPNREGQLDALKNLEKIDPYDNYILFELAKFYKINSMSKQLAEVKQRFSNSNRLKTEDEIEFMNSL